MNLNYPVIDKQSGLEIASSNDDCCINVQVASGWVVTGYYRNNVLQTVTLQKTAEPTISSIVEKEICHAYP